VVYNNFSVKLHHAQKGVVLAVALIMLVLITLLAVSAMRTTIMEERMASNSRNDNIAFQLAETALRQAEERLLADPDSIRILKALNQIVLADPSLSCEILLNSEDLTDQSRWDAVACDYVGDADKDINDVDIARTPHYFIEFLRADSPPVPATSPPRNCFYRITARGYGPDANSAVTLQSTYKFNACS
jgi:type IV pilus assembly protein PilX